MRGKLIPCVPTDEGVAKPEWSGNGRPAKKGQVVPVRHIVIWRTPLICCEWRMRGKAPIGPKANVHFPVAPLQCVRKRVAVLLRQEWSVWGNHAGNTANHRHHRG